MITFAQLQQQVHQTAREKGWWPLFYWDEDTVRPTKELEAIDLEKVNIPEKLMLMVSELGEALEFYRNDNEGQGIDKEVIFKQEAPAKPDGLWVELADVIIRVLDLAGAYNIDMEKLVKEKHEYNKTRPYRHGGKKC